MPHIDLANYKGEVKSLQELKERHKAIRKWEKGVDVLSRLETLTILSLDIATTQNASIASYGRENPHLRALSNKVEGLTDQAMGLL